MVYFVIMVLLGLIAAFVLKLPVFAVYFIISLDEFVKIPAVYLNDKKYRWVKDLTVSQGAQQGPTAAAGTDKTRLRYCCLAHRWQPAERLLQWTRGSWAQ